MDETHTAEDDLMPPSNDKAMTTSNIIRIIQATLIAIGLAFGISVVVGGRWWSDNKPHLDLDALGQQVTSSMQTQFDKTAETKNLGLHVGKDMMLINVNGNGNEYRGMVTVSVVYPNRFDPDTHEPKPASSTDIQVSLTAYADDTGRMMWQLDPGSNAKLITTAEKPR